MKTLKIFSEDAYQKECEATVLEIKKDDEGRQIVVLDQTVFYAMSGGQPGDTGTITGPEGVEQVIDTRYASDEKVLIYHYVSEDTKLKVGDKVQCQIDWERRYRLMRLHSLVHIAGLLFEKKYGKTEVFGSNISDKGRIDYKYFDPIDFEWLSVETQRYIDEGHEIKTRGEDGNEVRRIWEMADLEPMPCGGTHPKNSSEIGKIRLKRKGLGSQGQRIYCMLEE
jgi:alanyl-tRNA synthetase